MSPARRSRIAWWLRALAAPCLALSLVALPVGATEPAATPEAPARFRLELRDVELTVFADLVSAITGKSFLFDDGVRQKVSVLSPGEVTADDAWLLFQAALDAGGTYTLLPVRGKAETYLIVPRREAARMATPVVADTRAVAVPPLRYADAGEVAELVELVLPSGTPHRAHVDPR